MRILQMLPALEVGGVERGTVDLARALKARGEGVAVISSGGALVEELERAGIPHYTLPIARKSFFSLTLVPRVVEVIRKENIDIVHARSRVPAWIGWFAAKKAKVPFVTTCHGYYSTHFLSRVMGWGQKVIVPSLAIGRHMIENFKVRPERIVVIPRGVDLSQFPFHPQKYDGPLPKVYRILNLGRFTPLKGQVDFLRAIHRVRQSGLPMEVWLAGGEAKGQNRYTQEIEKTIHQLGLQKIVKILGIRRHVAELLAEADILVLSSRVPEAFGRVLIEAGAVGTACVATKLGGVLDIIEDGREGLLVPPQDEEAMAQAIRHLLLQREEAKEMAKRLRAKVEQKFSLETMVDSTLEVYRRAKHEKRILVIKLGALGDVILATPSLRMIRKKFPQAYLTLLVDSRYSPLLSCCPYVDQILPVERRKLRSWTSLFRLAKRLRCEGYQLSVDFQNTKQTHLLAFLARIPERYGFYRGPFGGFLTHPDFGHSAPDPPVRHQFKILSRLGFNQLDERLELWPDPDSEARITRWLGEMNLSPEKILVGLALGSSPRWLTKRWPLEFYQALAGQLIKKLDCYVLLLGSREEEALVAEFSGDSGRVINAVGQTSLVEIVSLMRRLHVLVTGDTAPLHIAAALGIRTVALFGPTDPRRHLPPSGGVSVLTRRLPCQPCYKGICHYVEKMACLKRISPEEVFEAVRRHLADLLLVKAT